MQRADIAERVLPQLPDQTAKTVGAKEGTALVVRQPEVPDPGFLDKRSTQIIAELARQRPIISDALLIHVDLPAEAAAVAAERRFAGKGAIEIGVHTDHGRPPPSCQKATALAAATLSESTPWDIGMRAV